MYIYIIYYFVNIIFLFFKKNKIVLAIFFIFINFFYSFNYLNGVDWIHYEILFNEIPSILSNEYLYKISQIKVQGIEYLFIILISFFKIIPNIKYSVFQSILLTINLFIIYKFVLKNSQRPILVMILSTRFLTAVMFEPLLRQLQSICIFYLSIRYIINRSCFKYILLNILSIMFHTSALIILPLYFIGNIKYKLKNKILIILFVFISLNFLDFILENFFTISIFRHYNYYLTNINYGLKKIDITQVIKLFILDIGIYFWIEINMKKINKNTRNFNVISNIYFISIIFKILNLKLPIFYRFNNYMYLIYIVYICFIFDIIKNKYKKILIESIFIFYFGFTYVSMIKESEIKDTGRYIPYSNYLFENKNDNFMEKIYQRLKKSKIKEDVLKSIDKNN